MWLMKDVCVHEHMVQGMSWGQTGDKCVTGGGTEARLETTMEQGELLWLDWRQTVFSIAGGL